VKYKILFNSGDELTLKTKVEQGEAWIDDASLHARGKKRVLRSEERGAGCRDLSPHGTARVIR